MPVLITARVVLDRSQAPIVWREARVVHGGPILAAIDAQGRVVTWGARAEQLTGLPAKAAHGQPWASVLLAGTDDMIMDSEAHANKVLAGQAEGNAYVSICTPIRDAHGNPSVVAPMLIRPVTSAEHGVLLTAAAAAVVLEAATDIALLSVFVGGERSAGGAAKARQLEMSLEPFNHAPRLLSMAAFDKQLRLFMQGMQMELGCVYDPVDGTARPAGMEPVPVTLAANAPIHSDVNDVNGAAPAPPSLKDVTDARALWDQLQAAHRANLANSEHASRLPIGAIVSGRIGTGKSTFLRQLGLHGCSTFLNLEAAAAATALVPLLVPVPQLARLLRSKPAAFASAWNYAAAFVTHAIEGELLQLTLLQCLMQRRCVVLLDGVSDGGLVGENERAILEHVVQVLVPQGHALVATIRDEAIPADGSSSSNDRADGCARADDPRTADGHGPNAEPLRLSRSARLPWLQLRTRDGKAQRAYLKSLLQGNQSRLYDATALANAAEQAALDDVQGLGEAAADAAANELASPLLLACLAAAVSPRTDSSLGFVATFTAATCTAATFKPPDSFGALLSAAVDRMLRAADQVQRAISSPYSPLACKRSPRRRSSHPTHPLRRLITPRMQALTTAPPLSANQVQRAWPLDPQTFQAQRAACEAIALAAHLKGAPKPAPLQLPQASGAGGTAAATAAATESISDASTETTTPMTAGLAACVLTEAEVLEALEGVGMGAAAAAWPALRRRLARGTLSAADDL